MWGLRYDHAAQKVTWHDELADTTVKMASFGLGRDGSFYAVDYDRGEIYQLERQPPAPPLPPFPRKLSETGVFTSVVKHQVAPGVIPYEINAPFWSDGAHKERFFVIPDIGKVNPTISLLDDNAGVDALPQAGSRHLQVARPASGARAG